LPRDRIDKVDLKLINSLKNNARSSITELAKEAGISRPTAMKRLETMLKEGTLGIEAGLNLKKLGFQIGCVGLEVIGAAARRELQNFLQICPRVLLVFCPFEKVNFSVYVYGEDQETLRSVIYSLNEFPNTSIAYVNYSDPPLNPATLPVPIHVNKGSETPCGKVCSTCISYIEELCLGCPAVVDYKGPL
jgi:Lrp/AsnC family leucine-responsive transcriptional regulator